MTAQNAIHELKQVRQYCSARAIPAIDYAIQVLQGLAEREKRVEEAKCNPWCLRKLYLATRSEIERNVRILAEQAYEQILDAEQLGTEDSGPRRRGKHGC